MRWVGEENAVRSKTARRSKSALKPTITWQKWLVLGIIGAVLVGGAALLTHKTHAHTAIGGYGGNAPYVYAVGKPGPGDKAPEFSLESTSGNKVSLADYKGKNVLLFFQEGLMCDACWSQVTDLEKDAKLFKDKFGVDQLLVITPDPISLLVQKAQVAVYKSPLLSDKHKAVSTAYDALKYGMMNGANPGHTFLLVGQDGVIKWRADYGGSPDYAMYVPDS